MGAGGLEQEAALGRWQLPPQVVRKQTCCNRVPGNRWWHAHIVPRDTIAARGVPILRGLSRRFRVGYDGMRCQNAWHLVLTPAGRFYAR